MEFLMQLRLFFSVASPDRGEVEDQSLWNSYFNNMYFAQWRWDELSIPPLADHYTFSQRLRT